MERNFRPVSPAGSDYLRHVVENGTLQDEIEPLAKAGFFGGDVIFNGDETFDRKVFDRQWNEDKNKRHEKNRGQLDGQFYNGTYYRHGVGQRRG